MRGSVTGNFGSPSVLPARLVQAFGLPKTTVAKTYSNAPVDFITGLHRYLLEVITFWQCISGSAF